jgi:hypothetical protein
VISERQVIIESELVGEDEILGENLPKHHIDYQKSHIIYITYRLSYEETFGNFSNSA